MATPRVMCAWAAGVHDVWKFTLPSLSVWPETAAAAPTMMTKDTQPMEKDLGFMRHTSCCE